jgi:hypothetical protein
MWKNSDSSHRAPRHQSTQHHDSQQAPQPRFRTRMLHEPRLELQHRSYEYLIARGRAYFARHDLRPYILLTALISRSSLASSSAVGMPSLPWTMAPRKAPKRRMTSSWKVILDDETPSALTRVTMGNGYIPPMLCFDNSSGKTGVEGSMLQFGRSKVTSVSISSRSWEQARVVLAASEDVRLRGFTEV